MARDRAFPGRTLGRDVGNALPDRHAAPATISSKPPARASRMWQFDVERDFALTDFRRTALPMRERVAPIEFACDCLLSTLRRFVARASATRHPADRELVPACCLILKRWVG